MDELVRWLAAQLDEDERIARAAGGDVWRRQDDSSDTVAIYDSKGEPVVYDEGWPTEEQQAHIVRHDPARVLREIDAKRRILGEVAPEVERAETMIEDEWHASSDTHGDLLRLLALPYADRPGYLEEWRP